MAKRHTTAERQADRVPPPRLGPRPLPLHLTLAVLAWQSSKSALPLLSPGSLPWSAGLARPAAALREDLAGVEAEALRGAVEAEANRRLRALLVGLQAYRTHPYRRSLADPPALWSEGTTRLRDYGAANGGGGAGGAPLLVVPSLINRAYILDLEARVSLLRWLAARGFRPFLVDWGAPGEVERRFTLTDYVAGRLERALDRVLEETGERPRLVGYCMGGLLALALALRRGEDLAGLALLATPWDFHAEFAAQARLAGAGLAALAPVIEAQGALPVDVIQSLFAMLDPLQVVRKFIAFSRLDPEDPRAIQFVALEDWLNDGVALAAPVARECLGAWYRENATVARRWRIAGRVVEPEALDLPALCVVPGNDRIVPPASARALARALPRVTAYTPVTGHIGMIASAGARRRVWRRLAGWLADPVR